ncbi:MAG: hypothetical protein PVH12_01270 [Candidatus Bathyarchaeota archaeon]|jgi:hypothetical protein
MPNPNLGQRFKITLGGFLSFMGIVILAFTFMVITGNLDLENILHSDLYTVIISIIVVIGSLDILAGILLVRSR